MYFKASSYFVSALPVFPTQRSVPWWSHT